MKVLKVIPGVTPDAGTERSLQAMAPGMLAAGVQLHLAVLTARQDLVPELERQGVVVHDLSGQRHLPGRVRALRTVIRAVRPDVVHASLFEATVPAQLAVVGTGVPLLISWANTHYGEGRHAEPDTTRWKLEAVRCVEAVLGRVSHSSYHAVTPAVGTMNAAALHADPARVHVGERGRDPELFAVTTPDRSVLPVELRCDPAARIVVAVGRQDPQKGYETLLTEFDRLVDSHPDAHLLVAGRDGRATPLIRQVHGAMRHPDAVQFLGQRDDVVALMACADAVVSSSWREGAAGALIEAMASCRPIVAVPIDGLEGILVDGENAVVVPRDHLADGLARVLDDGAVAAELAAGGRRTFEDRFTIEASTARMVEIYREVAAAG